MDTKTKPILESLGFSTNEIKFYVIALELSPTTIGKVAKYLRMDRSSAYLAFEKLKKNNLITEDFKKYKKTIYAESPKKIIQLLENQQRKLKRRSLELEELLPSLMASYQKKTAQPKITFYEGKDALQKIENDVLSSCKKFLLYTNQEDELKVFSKKAHNNFIKKRIAKKIKIKVLAVKQPESEELKKTDLSSLRETKFVPSDCCLTSETYIYDDKVAMLGYHNEIFGFIVESKEFAETQKNIFMALWKKI